MLLATSLLFMVLGIQLTNFVWRGAEWSLSRSSSRQALGGGGAHRLAAHLRHDGRAHLRTRRRPEPRVRGDHGLWRLRGLDRGLSGNAAVVGRGGSLTSEGSSVSSVRRSRCPSGCRSMSWGLGITLLRPRPPISPIRIALPEVTSPPRIEPFRLGKSRFCRTFPLLGEALFSQTPLTYAAFATVAITAFVLYRPPLGLAVRAAGENRPRSSKRRAVGSSPCAWAR